MFPEQYSVYSGGSGEEKTNSGSNLETEDRLLLVHACLHPTAIKSQQLKILTLISCVILLYLSAPLFATCFPDEESDGHRCSC